MAIVAYVPDQAVAYDSLGVRESGARLFFYLYNTVTPVAIFQDPGGSTPAANPLLSLSDGTWPQVYWDNDTRTRVVKLSPVGSPHPATWQVDDIGALFVEYLLPDLSNVDATAEEGAQFLLDIQANAHDIAYAAPNGVAQTVEDKLNLIVMVTDYGADPSGVANSQSAFMTAAALIVTQGGGHLIVPQGTYLWGEQTLAGATGLGYAWRGFDLIDIHDCTLPVVIELQGAKFLNVDGLRFGSFNPVTGAPAGSSVAPDNQANIGDCISLTDNADVTIMGAAEMDGNLINATIGGPWGGSGRQNIHSGIRAYGNDRLSMENLNVHHFCLDAYTIGYPGTTTTSRQTPHAIKNCSGLYCGRQGLSWVGGNNFEWDGGEFSHIGKAFNTSLGGVLFSSPGAGIDIEPELAVCRNGLFKNVYCFDNAGAALLADQGDAANITVKDSTLIGTTLWSLWALKPRFVIENCVLVGAVAWLLGDADPALAAKVSGGKWSMDVADSPSGVIYAGGGAMDLGAALNVTFEAVDFRAAGALTLPFSANTALYSNCTFTMPMAATTTYFTDGTFTGLNIFNTPGAGFNTNGVTCYGRLEINDVTGNYVFSQVGQPFEYVALNTNDGVVARTIYQGSYYDPTGMFAFFGDIPLGSICWNSGALAPGDVSYWQMTNPTGDGSVMGDWTNQDL